MEKHHVRKNRPSTSHKRRNLACPLFAALAVGALLPFAPGASAQVPVGKPSGFDGTYSGPRVQSGGANTTGVANGVTGRTDFEYVFSRNQIDTGASVFFTTTIKVNPYAANETNSFPLIRLGFAVDEAGTTEGNKYGAVHVRSAARTPITRFLPTTGRPCCFSRTTRKATTPTGTTNSTTRTAMLFLERAAPYMVSLIRPRVAPTPHIRCCLGKRDFYGYGAVSERRRGRHRGSL